MKHLILTLMACVPVLILQSCANHELVEEKVEEPEEKLDKLVARVSSVNKGAEYVLIQRYGRLEIPEDSIVYTLNNSAGQEQASSLKITGERLGQFLAADIMSGDPAVGDAVYLRNLERKVTKTTLQPLAPNHPGTPQNKSQVIEQETRELEGQSESGVIENLKPKQNEPDILPPTPGDKLLPIVN